MVCSEDARSSSSVPVSFVQVDVQTDPRWAKTNSNVPSPREGKISQKPHPRANYNNQIPTPCPAPPPPALN